MRWESYNSEQKRTAIIRLLAELSKTDGKVQGKELLYLLDVGQKFNMSAEQVRGILYSEEPVDMPPPTLELDRMTILYYMLFMMKMDGVVTKQEENLIYHYGFKLGFGESLLREMIAAIKGSLGKTLDSNELLLTIKKYMN